MNKLCQHNFGNNRQPIAFENYAGIIGSSVGLLSAHAHDLCGYAPVYTFFSPQNMPMTRAYALRCAMRVYISANTVSHKY